MGLRLTKLSIKETCNLMEQFERDYDWENLKRAVSNLYSIQIYYCNEHINHLFIAYCKGYGHARYMAISGEAFDLEGERTFYLEGEGENDECNATM